jgi:gliding motility-associated-like protein
MLKQLILLLTISMLSTVHWSQNQVQTKFLRNKSVQHKALFENKGQWPTGVLFNAEMNGGKLWIQQKKMVYHLQDYSAMQKAHAGINPNFKDTTIRETVVHLNFPGANEVREIEKKNKTAYYHNYFIGNDQKKWASEVYGYHEVILKEFYNGIDMRYIGKGDEIKYEFIVKPQVNPNVIVLNYANQKSLKLDKKGNLIITTELGQIQERYPLAFQSINGKLVGVKVKFKLEGNNVRFELGKYDPKYELIIDPTLIFSTWVGAVSDNFGMTATYGYDGTAYTGGIVYGRNYPTPDNQAYNIASNFTVTSGSYGITDVYISKFNPTGTQMLWTTFVGGGNNNSGTETVHSMICDLDNNLYFFGATSSANFPITANAYDNSFNGGSTTPNTNFYFNGVYYQNLGTDIYVAKLSANGHNLLGSTFVGGTGNDGINYVTASLPYDGVAAYSNLVTNYGDQFRGEIMLDNQNNIVVASCTRSTNFPTVQAIQGTNGGGQDGVIFKLAADFQSLLFSSYYGGSQDDACYSVKVDGSDNIVFAGGTRSNNLIATTGGFQPAYAGGSTDGFVVKMPPNGSTITQASYVGRNNYDQVFFVEIDRDDNIFLLGQSAGGTFPIVNAQFSNNNGSNFIIKLNPALTTNLGSTRFGNNSTAINISPAAFLVDVCGNIYVSGWGANILQNTPLSGMPVTPGSYQDTPPNGFDFYLLVIKSNFEGILYGTYIGGDESTEHVDGGTSRFDKNGIVYQSVCAGCGGRDDFPTTNGAWSATNNSTNCNNVIYKFDTDVIPIADFSSSNTSGCANFTVTLTNNSNEDSEFWWDFGDGNIDSVTYSPVITYTTPGTFEVNLYVRDSVCDLVDTARITINVLDSIRLDVPDTLRVCNSGPFNLTALTYGTATSIIWSLNANMTNPINANNNPTISVVPPPGWYYVQAGNGLCSKKDSVFVLFDVSPNASFTLNNSSGCAPLSVTFTNTSPQTETILWTFGNGTTNSTNNTVTVVYDQPGTYNVSLFIQDPICPADDIAFATITVSPNIQINLVDEIALCNPVPITLNPTFVGNPNTFVWSSNNQFTDTLNTDLSNANLTINDPQNGYYYLWVSNGDCINRDSVLVNFTSADLTLSGNVNICLGNSTVITAQNSNPLVNFNYNWSPTNLIVSGNGTNEITVAPTFSQYVYLNANSSNGCFVADSIFINVSNIDPSVVVASASEYLVLPNTTVVLSGAPSGFASYSWTPTTGLSTPNEQNTNALMTENTIYTLTVSDGICSVSDTVQVRVYEIICEDPYVFIPNAFTPNGDNNNDVLYVRGIWIEKMIFRIFDRWGEMVFESEDVNKGWDGTFRGKKLDPDVYDFYLDVTCIGGLKSITKGNVTLMK